MREMREFSDVLGKADRAGCETEGPYAMDALVKFLIGSSALQVGKAAPPHPEHFGSCTAVEMCPGPVCDRLVAFKTSNP